MADKPLWRQAFDAVESRAAGPVEAGAHSDVFGDLITLNVRLARRDAAGGRAPHPPAAAHGEPLDRDRRPPAVRAGGLAAARGARARRTPAVSPSLAPADCSTAIRATSSAPSAAAATACATPRARSRPKVGQTPKDVVWQRDKAELWRYRSDDIRVTHAGGDRAQPHQPQLRARPLSRQQRSSHSCSRRASTSSCSTGASPTRSTPATRSRLRRRGHPRRDRRRCEAAGTEEVTLLGYCFGGVLSLLSAARHPELPIRNLVADGHAGGLRPDVGDHRARARGPARAGRDASSRPATSRPT